MAKPRCPNRDGRTDLSEAEPRGNRLEEDMSTGPSRGSRAEGAKQIRAEGSEASEPILETPSGLGRIWECRAEDTKLKEAYPRGLIQ